MSKYPKCKCGGQTAKPEDDLYRDNVVQCKKCLELWRIEDLKVKK